MATRRTTRGVVIVPGAASTRGGTEAAQTAQAALDELAEAGLGEWVERKGEDGLTTRCSTCARTRRHQNPSPPKPVATRNGDARPPLLRGGLWRWQRFERHNHLQHSHLRAYPRPACGWPRGPAKVRTSNYTPRRRVSWRQVLGQGHRGGDGFRGDGSPPAPLPKFDASLGGSPAARAKVQPRAGKLSAVFDECADPAPLAR